MKFNKAYLVPAVLILLVVTLFVTVLSQKKVEDTSNSDKTSISAVSTTSSPTPAPHQVLGAETKQTSQSNSSSDSTDCGRITTVDELKEITGKIYKKQSITPSEGKTVDCKYTSNGQVIEFYLLPNGESQYDQSKSQSSNVETLSDYENAFIIKDSNNMNLYILDNGKLLYGSMPGLNTDQSTKDKLTELTTRMMVRD